MINEATPLCRTFHELAREAVLRGRDPFLQVTDELYRALEATCFIEEYGWCGLPFVDERGRRQDCHFVRLNVIGYQTCCITYS